MKIAVQKSPWSREDLYEEAGFEIKVGTPTSEAEMIELLHDADAAQINTQPLTSRAVLEASPKLKVVSRMGVGVDSIDLDAATELGILACNVPGANTAEVADHAMAMLLALTRQLHYAVPAMRGGMWSDDRSGTFARVHDRVQRIAGHTVGIIGFGDIGRAFANRVRGFGPAQIVATDPYVRQSTADLYGVKLLPLDELAAVADFITIHSSATQETRHLVDARVLSLMKPTAIVVNTARGPIVDNAAIADALESGTIAAAALDVTEVEPLPSDSRLLQLDNCIVTPHCAGFSPVFLHECPIRQAESIIRVLTGEAPHGLANPEVIKTIAVMRSTDPGRWTGIPDFSTALPL